jgi:hypothetical protein
MLRWRKEGGREIVEETVSDERRGSNAVVDCGEREPFDGATGCEVVVRSPRVEVKH